MRSVLHQYQRQSVAAMLERELYSVDIPDPLYIPIRGVQGVPSIEFFLQPGTMEILTELSAVGRMCGGILCEELGTGKTVMTLGLILATIDQLPSPQGSMLDPRLVLTPLALRYFPTEEFSDMRAKIAQHQRRRRKDKRGEEVADGLKVPSLVEQLLHLCCTRRDEVQLHDGLHQLEEISLQHSLHQNQPFYYFYDIDPIQAVRSDRNKNKDVIPKKIYLTAATLVIVPPNLFNQWLNEINKHCDDSITSRVYTAKSGSLPSARDLASLYDVRPQYL